MDLLSWTYLALRVKSNPTYYDIYPGHEEEGVSRMVDEWYVGNEFGLPMGLDKLKSNGESSSKVGDDGRTPEVGVEVVAEEKVGEADGETLDPVK